MFRLVIAATSVFAATLGASAADLAGRGAPAWTWTGLYAGLNAGAGWGAGAADFYTLGGARLRSVSSTSGGAGFRGGGQIGYRYQLPSDLVLGVQATFEAAPDKALASGGVAFKASGRVEASVAGQLGYAFGDALPYAQAGFSVENIDLALTAPGVVGADTATPKSFLLGAGLDYRLWGAWIVSAQYQTQWTQAYRFTFPTAGFSVVERGRTQAVTVGLSYKF